MYSIWPRWAIIVVQGAVIGENATRERRNKDMFICSVNNNNNNNNNKNNPSQYNVSSMTAKTFVYSIH